MLWPPLTSSLFASSYTHQPACDFFELGEEVDERKRVDKVWCQCPLRQLDIQVQFFFLLWRFCGFLQEPLIGVFQVPAMAKPLQLSRYI